MGWMDSFKSINKVMKLTKGARTFKKRKKQIKVNLK